MEGIQDKKIEIRNETEKKIEALADSELTKKYQHIEKRLFEFANFLESKISLLYMNTDYEVNTRNIVQKCFDYNKVVVLPVFEDDKRRVKLMKANQIDTDLVTGARGVLEPNPERCKPIPIESIDIAIIPGIAFDEKGGRIGTGRGYYDKLIPRLSITTRKVALALECQIVAQIPMESHDRHVDIIITEDRIIYKI